MWLMESGRKEPKECVVNDEIKVAVSKKESAWNEVLAASDEKAKERCEESYKKRKEEGYKEYISEQK